MKKLFLLAILSPLACSIATASNWVALRSDSPYVFYAVNVDSISVNDHYAAFWGAKICPSNPCTEYNGRELFSYDTQIAYYTVECSRNPNGNTETIAEKTSYFRGAKIPEISHKREISVKKYYSRDDAHIYMFEPICNGAAKQMETIPLSSHQGMLLHFQQLLRNNRKDRGKPF